jgi:hypothetical protein
MDYSFLSEIKDVRIYAQLLCDFFDGLCLAACSLDNIEKIRNIFESNKDEIPLFEICNNLKKQEFHTLKYFALLQRELLQADPKAD